MYFVPLIRTSVDDGSLTENVANGESDGEEDPPEDKERTQTQNQQESTLEQE